MIVGPNFMKTIEKWKVLCLLKGLQIYVAIIFHPKIKSLCIRTFERKIYLFHKVVVAALNHIYTRQRQLTLSPQTPQTLLERPRFTDNEPKLRLKSLVRAVIIRVTGVLP